MCLEKERKKERKREREREKMREGVEYPPAINIAINDFFRFYIYKKIFNIPSPVGKGENHIIHMWRDFSLNRSVLRL